MKASRSRKLRAALGLEEFLNRLPAFSFGDKLGIQAPATVRRSLRWFILDGIFANAGGTILSTYQSVYLLALGATRGQIGLLGAITNLTMPAAMLPGARLASGSWGYKRIVVIASLIARISLLGLIVLPFLALSAHAVPLAIGMLAIYGFFMNLLNPAWTAYVGQIVSPQWRGRYFSTRNILMGITAIVVGLTIGRVVDAFRQPLGYQVAFALTLMAGLAATYAFTHVEAPKALAGQVSAAPRASGEFWKQLRTQKRFLANCGTAALWSLSVQIAASFFFVYLVDETGATATSLATVTALASFMALPGQRIFGTLNDRKGAVWVRKLTGFVIPLVPAIWGFMTQPWHAYPVQAISGFAWAGYNLAAFNQLLDITPEQGRSSYVAFYQAVVGLGMTVGAAMGGIVAQQLGYRAMFLLSAGLRMLSAIVFALVESSPAFRSRQLERVQQLRSRFPERRRRQVQTEDDSADGELCAVDPDAEARP